ncbi:Ig-like domain-containing protein [Pontibacter pamirensis]|uniref:Ig-like domain-containing protein n=1 Tax=Pontibacter pamirensis TaxID=2562824 RepID=UPI001389AA44|nr:Ig-like domain-containing protein [Pontibacter pamirensis]
MEKINWLFLFLFAFAIAACDDEDDVAPDADAPEIAITSPAVNTSFLVIDEIELRANVTDNREVEQVRIYLSGPDGDRRQVDEVNIDFVNDSRNENLKVTFYMAEGSAAGIYTMIVEAQDEQQNTSESAVNINVQAPDLEKVAFNTALTKNTFFRKRVINNGASLTEGEFGTSVFHIMDRGHDGYVENNEFDKFTVDFDLETSSDWYYYDEFDGLSLGTLNALLRKVKFFDDWDLDNNNLLNEAELTGGIFGRWDDNEDGVLSRNEYESKMHTYFIP